MPRPPPTFAACSSTPDEAPLVSLLAIFVDVNDHVLSRHLSDTDLAVLRVTCKAARTVVDALRMRRHAAFCAFIFGGTPAGADATSLPKLLIGGDANDCRWEVLLSVLPAEDVFNDSTLLNLVGRAPLPAPPRGTARRRVQCTSPSVFQRAMVDLEDLNVGKRAALLLATRAAQHGASYAALRPLLLAMRLVVEPAAPTAMSDVSGCACLGSTVSSRRAYERSHKIRPVHGEALFCHLLFHGHDIPLRFLNVALSMGPHVELMLPYAKAARLRSQALARQPELPREGGLSVQALVDHLRAESLHQDSQAVEFVLTRADEVLTQEQRSTALVRALALLGRVDILARLMSELKHPDVESDRKYEIYDVLLSDGAPIVTPMLPETTTCTMALSLWQKTLPLSLLVVAAEMAITAEGWRRTPGGAVSVVRHITARACRRGVSLMSASMLPPAPPNTFFYPLNALRWVEGCMAAWPAAVPVLLTTMYLATEAAGAFCAGENDYDDDVRAGRAWFVQEPTLRMVLAVTDPSLHDDGGRFQSAIRLERLATQLPWIGPLLTAPPRVRPSRSVCFGARDPLLAALEATPTRLALVAWLVREGGAVPVQAVRMRPDLLLPLVAARPHAFAGARMAAANEMRAARWNAYVLSSLTTEELAAYAVAVAEHNTAGGVDRAVQV